MSLDISLYDNSKPENEREVADMNWLRNPFGLERWAYWNTYHEFRERPEDRTLWHVCNHWAYDQSQFVDRELFYNVAWDYLNVLAHKYAEGQDFYFAFWNNRLITEYVTRYREWFPNQPGTRGHVIEGAFWLPDDNGNDQGTLMVPIRHFEIPHIESSIRLGRPEHQTMTQRYMAWYYELLYFAKLLVENPEFEFYCSN